MSVLPPSLLAPRASSRDGTWPVRNETITFRDIVLEGGDQVNPIDVHYRLEGAINRARDNVVLIIHALTGTVRASEWWKGVIGVGAALDPTTHAILCANLLGGCDGTTGPTNSTPDALPPITTRDQAAVLARLLDALGVSTPLLVCGGSLGGMVTLEFAASFPERVRGAVCLAAPAVQTAQGLAWNTIMRRAIALGGERDGLALARMVGMLSYRTPEGLERRFGRSQEASGVFQVNAWLDAHGEKLLQRFDAASYGALIDAMDAHDVGRGRGGVRAALSPPRRPARGGGYSRRSAVPGSRGARVGRCLRGHIRRTAVAAWTRRVSVGGRSCGADHRRRPARGRAARAPSDGVITEPAEMAGEMTRGTNRPVSVRRRGHAATGVPNPPAEPSPCPPDCLPALP